LTELLRESNEKKVELLKKDLLSNSLVRFWLSNLHPNFDKNVMHSGKSEAFENAMGKLYEFGLRKGTKALDEKTEPFRRWLAQQIRLPNDGYFPVFYRTLTAAFLTMTGYYDDEAVSTMVLRRLDTIYPFAKKGNLNEVYISQDSSKFQKSGAVPLVNPELYPNDEMKLPWIHDINAFLHFPSIMENTQLRSKVETIISFILKPEYQKLHPGYGVIRKETGKYYVMGWSVHLPSYFEKRVEPKDFGRFLLLLKMMSLSKTAKKHWWFKRSLSLLERFRTEDGLIAFPHSFIPEKKIGYWVLGTRMALEINRRVQKAIKCESTFRVMEITTKTYENY